MQYPYKAYLLSIFSKVATCTRHGGAVYHSDFDTQIGEYDSTIQLDVHSIWESLEHILEDLHRDDVPTDSQ